MDYIIKEMGKMNGEAEDKREIASGSKAEVSAAKSGPCGGRDTEEYE